MILSNTLLPEEHRQLWERAKLHSNETHQTTPAHPIGAEAVPDQDPNWDYNNPQHPISRDQFITCLMVGLRKSANNAINYEKLQEVIQDKNENPSMFVDCLTKALLQYTNLDPETPEGRQLLMTYFFSQSFPDIKAKLKCLHRGPLTPRAEVLAGTFKVYNGRDEKALKQKYQQKYQLMAKAFQPTPATGTHIAPLLSATTSRSLF